MSPTITSLLPGKELRSRNIPYDTRQRQIDRQTSRGQKPDIPLRSISLKMCSRVTPDISTKLPRTSDKTTDNTFKQDSLQLPIQIQRYERYTQQDPINVPHPQTSIYQSSMTEKNIFTEAKEPSVENRYFWMH